MWSERKNTHIHIRVTERTDKLLNNIVEVGNKHKIRVNGGQNIDNTILLAHCYELMAHMSREKKEEAVISLLSNFPALRDEFNEPLSIEKIKNIAKEICI